MPFINVKTNAKLTAEQAEAIKSQFGEAIMTIPGKTEGWLMVGLEDGYQLYFRGTQEPAAMVSVSLFGSPSPDATDALTGALTAILNEALGISADRIYVSYMMTNQWGWNGSNF
ncbi:MAG: hypothetical protein K5705_14170 [Oscillospiraceae bacterium]|nr:hypothetical protein [Oscillospiraceae bacterium]MCR4761384.1 hypothetical protein [Oscillospiraceae bacterium]